MNNRRIRIVAAAAGIAAVAIVAVLLYFWPQNAGKLAEPDGTPWSIQGRPMKLGEAYVPIAENDRLKLSMNGTGHITVENKRSGSLWYSNPDQSALDADPVKGFWRSNLTSAFQLSYTDAVNKPQLGNADNSEAHITIEQIDQGVAVTFDLQAIDIRFTAVVTLYGEYLEVAVPSDSIVESGERRLVSLSMYPLFGAEQGSRTKGYMFVPDQTGGLIDFRAYNANPQRYSVDVYRGDLSITQQDPYDGTAESTSLFPVFGMAYGDNAFVGIIDEGDFTARINATPSGMYTTFNWIAAEFIYRNPYFKRTSKLGDGFVVYEKNRETENRRVRYYLLDGDQADYVGMAKVYRDYLIETHGLRRLDAEVAIPLHLKLLGGNQEPGIFSRSWVTATTFDQGLEIVKRLNLAGIRNMNVLFGNWTDNGELGLPKRFPPESKLGGEKGLTRLIEETHRLQYKFYLEDNYVSAFGKAGGFNPRTDAVRNTDGAVIEYTYSFNKSFSFINKITQYWIRPELSERIWQGAVPQLLEWGIDGVMQDSIGGTVFSDNNSGHPSSRAESGSVYADLLANANTVFGSVGVRRGNAYTLEAADLIESFPLEPSYDNRIARNVPFYAIALHGLVHYTGDPGNLRNDNQRDFLKLAEYGALPSYLLTYEDPIVLKDTLDNRVFSSQYTEWIDQIAVEYQKLNEAFADVQDQFIVDHRRLAPDVYETTYENGTQIVVNYGSSGFQTGDLTVKANDFAVLRGD